MELGIEAIYRYHESQYGAAMSDDALSRRAERYLIRRNKQTVARIEVGSEDGGPAALWRFFEGTRDASLGGRDVR